MSPETASPPVDIDSHQRDLGQRDLRQRDLVPPDRLAACQALVVGVGAIGRQVALQLSALGISEMTLFDDDRVGVENLAAQGYWTEDLGLPKVAATAALCRRLHPPIQVQPVAERFRRSTANDLAAGGQLIAFACVDSVSTRRLLWEALRCRAALFVDGRMSAEVVRVLASGAPASDDRYADTLFEEGEAFVGPCTARSTIYTASVAAGLMLGQFTRWLRRMPLECDLTLNLPASEPTVADRDPPNA